MLLVTLILASKSLPLLGGGGQGGGSARGNSQRSTYSESLPFTEGQGSRFNRNPPRRIWRYPGEARALLAWNGDVVAATAAGVFIRRRGTWSILGTDAPPALVALTQERGDLVGIDAAQRAFRLKDGRWQPDGTRAAGLRTPPALDAPPPGSQGAFLSAATPENVVRSFWGDTHYWRYPNGKPERWIARPPSKGDYALLNADNLFFAGTPDGVFAFDGKSWRKESLPGDLPLARPHGLARVGDQWLVGGLQGLWIGAPGRWEAVTLSPVRQIVGEGDAVWVLYGNGALDKLEPKLDRRHPDVLHGAARRPWASCLGWAGRSLLIGGDGGWIEKEGTKFMERYPAELKGHVVTAILGKGSVRFVGTQKGGLFRFAGNRVRVFNPGNGLRDPWVTALDFSESPTIATAGAGLFSLSGEKIRPLESPSARVRWLGESKGRLVIGTMEGAFQRTDARWLPYAAPGEEVTGLADLPKGLTIVSASGIYFPK